jgi:DNA-binding NarL/FixJ family response regulator
MHTGQESSQDNAGTVTTSRHLVARILIVDDHPLVRLGLNQMIAQEPDLAVCGEASNLADALQLYLATRPDAAIIDIGLKGGSGIDLIKQIKAHDEAARLLVCSVQDEALFAERALRAGATGYIGKDQAPEKILDALRRILAGHVCVSPRMAERLLQQRYKGNKDAGTTAFATLSDRELEVFGLIGEGLPSREIASQLNLSVKTVETHRERIKRKLNVDCGSELVRLAVQWTLERK